MWLPTLAEFPATNLSFAEQNPDKIYSLQTVGSENSRPGLRPLFVIFKGTDGADGIVDKTLPRDFALILRGLYDLSSGFL
ncbi:hypothetical protein M5K25_002436 [Dendrobium thyrsiflorum]|uniref:Uncharacterized protein n=1 Tax=Dendrobium thyrsiflorum TaxID=117978 RepID=A0ABD0VMD6_DENTH